MDMETVNISVTNEDLPNFGRIIKEAIPVDRSKQKHGRVIQFIIERLIKQAEEGSPDPFVTSREIYEELTGKTDDAQSKWMSVIWKEIEERRLPEIEQTILRLSLEYGLDRMPSIQKGKFGKEAAYRLVSVPIQQSEEATSLSSSKHAVATSQSGITYTNDLSLVLSRRGRLLFGKGLKLTKGKRWFMASWYIAIGIFAILLVFVALLVEGQKKTPLSGSDLSMFVFATVIPVLAFLYMRNTFRLIEDRIIIAPDWMLAWKEIGATVEIIRWHDTDEEMRVNVRRYTATCPVCKRMILLSNGGRDFPGRLVGRCKESPTEHVFSFDRVTCKGAALRVPPGVISGPDNTQQEPANI